MGKRLKVYCLKNEVWKDVVGYEGLYWVSSLGRVKNRKGRRLSQHKGKNGYLHLMLYKNGVGSNHSVHRVVASSFIGVSTSPVNHLDSNRVNNTVSNLEYCTPKENSVHAAKLSRFSTKLSLDDVYIIHMYSIFMGIQAISNYFGVHYTTIERVLTGKTWGHIWES